MEQGLRGEIESEVTDRDTVEALGSGDVPVLGTPRVIGLCEQATVAALTGHLAPGETSVGIRVQLDHLAPTAVGALVRTEAVVEKVEGRRVTFSVSAHDQKGLIAAGKVTRVLVDRDRFLGKLDS